MNVLEIGTRQDDKPITACVTRLAEAGEIPNPTTKKEPEPKLGKHDTTLLMVLEYQRSKWTPLPKGEGFPPSGFGMGVEVLRQAFYAKMDSEPGKKPTPDAKQKGFKRACKVLEDAKRIGIAGEWVWSMDQPLTEFSYDQSA